MDNTERQTAGAALATRLAAVGIDVIFGNSGTDFPPIIEGLVEAAAQGQPMPQTVNCPHETAAMGMAHGYYLATGRAQAVMVHTNVGLANAAMGAINARTDLAPMLLFSGRTPVLEAGRLGARTVPIGWGQEMLDQTALVREACKWDCELRFPEQVHGIVDRAHAIASSTPKGPVYVMLPREVLCETVAPDPSPPTQRAGRTAPAEGDMARAAALLSRATAPVIFAQRGADGAEAELDAMCTRLGIPVSLFWATRLPLATAHPMMAGPDPAPLLAEADVVLVLDSLAPWLGSQAPRPGATVIQAGPDPLFQATPVRGFRADLTLPGETGETIRRLNDLLGDRAEPARAARVADRNAATRAALAAEAEADVAGPRLTHAGLSKLVSDALPAEGTVFNELGVQSRHMDLRPGQIFDSPLSGGLGWGFPAALGYKMARPERTVIAALGDGSHIFANPVACHQIAEALGLSILVIVSNNAEWGMVRRSVLEFYPQGHAARANAVPLTDLAPSPDFAAVARASRGWATTAETPEAFAAALAEGLAHIRADRGLALIEARLAR